jgi:hypothetical protein
MRKRDVHKQQSEKAAAEQLLRTLEIDGVFLAYGDPSKSEPDVLFTFCGRKLGIEVATAWPTDSDARDHVTLETGERAFPECGYEMRSGGVLDSPQRRSCDRIQKEINDKCAKNYKGADEVWLCIEQRSQFLNKEQQLRECLKGVTMPTGHCFAKLYLLYQPDIIEGDGWRVIQFP